MALRCTWTEWALQLVADTMERRGCRPPQTGGLSANVSMQHVFGTCSVHDTSQDGLDLPGVQNKEHTCMVSKPKTSQIIALVTEQDVTTQSTHHQLIYVPEAFKYSGMYKQYTVLLSLAGPQRQRSLGSTTSGLHHACNPYLFLTFQAGTTVTFTMHKRKLRPSPAAQLPLNPSATHCHRPRLLQIASSFHQPTQPGHMRRSHGVRLLHARPRGR